MGKTSKKKAGDISKKRAVTKDKKLGAKAISKYAATDKIHNIQGKQAVQVQISKVLTDFDKLLNDKKVAEAQKLLNSLTGLKKWQKLNLQSMIEYAKGDEKRTEACLREALREDDVIGHVGRNLATVLVKQGRMREGLPFAEKSYESNPTDLKTLHVYINCLLDLGKSDRALEVCKKALETYPDDKLINVSQASSLRSQMKNDEALEKIDDLIIRMPEEPVVKRIKADILGDKDSSQALPYYQEALDLSIEQKGKPDPAIMWNMSLHLLRCRELEQGWDCWEQGFHPVVGTMGRNLPKRINDMERADADGKEIDRSKWTIICSEQGIGDQVLFMHSLNEAINELGKVLFVAEKRMHPILQRSFPGIVIGCSGTTYDWSRTSLAKNGYIPLGSIPRRHRKSVDAYHKHRVPFLKANKDLYQKYRSVLQKEANGRPIIGISWRGGFWQIQRKTKALDIALWEPIFKKDALFVNLQYGDISQDIKYINEKGHRILHFNKVNYQNDLDDWLAIAAACDGIISISTALVHFAGAVGQKVAVVMPGKQGPWHLGLEDKESLAYKNVRVFRPENEETIDKVVQRVADLIIENEI